MLRLARAMLDRSSAEEVVQPCYEETPDALLADEQLRPVSERILEARPPP